MFFKKILFLVICLPFFLSAEMSSTNYSISKDLLNFLGNESSSANYIFLDSAGEVSSSENSSNSYFVQSGFLQKDDYEIGFSCEDKNISLSSINLNGKASLSYGFNDIECNIFTNSPSGYVFSVASSSENLINIQNNSFLINPIPNIAPDYWPNSLTGGTGWGIHLGTESENFDSATWGNSNDYESSGGKWVKIGPDGFNVSNRNAYTDNNGDDQKIYFGAEVDENTVVGSGEYTTNIFFTIMPAF